MIRAKFTCNSVTTTTYGRVVDLSAAIDNGTPENNSFAEATPAGSMNMTITNPELHDYFQPGKSYFMDFTAAE